MEVLDALPHVSQSIDALRCAKPKKNFVIVPRCQLYKGLHVGGALVQESFSSSVELLLVLDQFQELEVQCDRLHLGSVRWHLPQEAC